MSRSLAVATSDRERAASLMLAAPQASPALDAGVAQELLSDVGFLLVPGIPLEEGASYLLVALRPRPTRVHFDPERIEYWGRENGRPAQLALEWPMAAPADDFCWGPIKIIDRVRAANGFVSFGGRLSVSRDHDVHAALFRSEAPILSLGGHSGPAHSLGINVAAFFAALRAAVGNSAELSSVVASLNPLALYAAFLARALRLYGGSLAAEVASPRVVSLLRAERCRLYTEHPSEEQAGNELAHRLSA